MSSESDLTDNTCGLPALDRLEFSLNSLKGYVDILEIDSDA